MAHLPRLKFQVSGSKLVRFAKKENKPTLRDRLRDGLISGTAGAYLGSMVLDGKVKLPQVVRKLGRVRRKTLTVHGARVGGALGAGLGIVAKPSKETADSVAGGGDWRFETAPKRLTPGQKSAVAAAGTLAAGGLVLGTTRGRNALRSVMAGGGAVRGLLSKAPGGNPRRVRLMKAQQKRKDLSNQRAASKAVDAARDKFRAEALPKPPAEPTLGDAVKTVKKRMKRKVVKAVSNIGANPSETAFSAYIEDMTLGELPKDVQKDIQRFVTAEKSTPVVHYGMTVKELLSKADPDNLKTARKALGTLRASRAADEVLGKIKDGSKYILLINDRIVDGHHFLAKAERGGVTSSLNVLDLTPARLTTRFSAAEMGQFLLEEMTEKRAAKTGAATGALTGVAVGLHKGRILRDLPPGEQRRFKKLAGMVVGRGVTLNERKVASKKALRIVGGGLKKQAPLLAVIGGIGGVSGAAGAAAGTHVVRRVRDKAKEYAGNHQFEEGRKNRTRDLRDKIGLAKDVAGLGVVTGAGVGGVKLYKAAKKGIQQAAPKVGAVARAWHKAALKTGKTLDTVKDAVAPAAATNRGIKAVGSKISSIARKATMWMHGDPRPVKQFQVSGSKFQEGKRSKLQNVRDAALTGAGVAVTGAGVAAALKAREAGKVADNIRNTTAIGADVGKVYRKARKVVTDSAEAFKGGLREAAGKPAPSWAKRTVRWGKKLRLLEEGSRFPVRGSRLNEFQVPSSRARLNEFILGALGTIAGTLAGSAAGAKFRYPVQNALKKKLVPKLGAKWGKRVARAGSFAPENAGALLGGAAGSILTGGLRKKREEDGSQFSVRGSRLNELAWQALHQFGGNEQLADLDNGRFPDPFKKWLKGEKAYRKIDVTDYHRLRRRLLGRDLKPEQIARIQGAMADIKDNKAVDIAGGQVLHSALRKADTVRKVTERGSGLVRDAVKAAKGEGREKDRWGREKKREWEKPWFQRRRNQLIATGGLLAAGYLGRHTKVGARAVRKGEEVINKGRNWANKKLANVFPDEGTEAARAAHNAKVTGKPQSTPADILKETEETAKRLNREARASRKSASKSPKVTPMPKSPAPASKPADSKPADKSVRAPVSQSPVSQAPASSGSVWSGSKLAQQPLVKTAASKLKKPKPPKQGVGQAKQPNYNGKTGKWEMNRLLAQALTQFVEKEKRGEAGGYAATNRNWPDGRSTFMGYKKRGVRNHLRRNAATYGGALAGNLVMRQAGMGGTGLIAGAAVGKVVDKVRGIVALRKALKRAGSKDPLGDALAVDSIGAPRGEKPKKKFNRLLAQALTQFADPLDVGWDIRDARGNSARVFAPHAGQRDRRPKRWHERVENERKLWAGAAAASTLAGGAAMRKILGKQTKQTVDREVKRRVAQIGAAVKKRYAVKRAAGSGGGRSPNVVPFTPKEAA